MIVDFNDPSTFFKVVLTMSSGISHIFIFVILIEFFKNNWNEKINL